MKNPGKKPIIKLDNVWRVYQLTEEIKIEALRGVSLEIKPGEYVAITGPSGSGKSTLLHMVGALDLPTKGKIFLDGKNISEMSESDLATLRGKKIGFVFQTFNLIPTLNALENVMLPMLFQKDSDHKKRARAEKLLKQMGLGDRMYNKPGELSGGQAQRVAIARSLANDPEIILADEPTGNLDTKTGKEVMDLLAGLIKKQGKTIIVVTHDMYVAKYVKGKIYNLKDGKIE